MCLCVCLSPHDLNFRFRLSRLGVLHSLKALCFTTIFTHNDQITLIFSYHSVWLFAIHEYTQPENGFSLCLDPAGHEKLAFFYLLMLLVLLFSLLLTFFFVYRVRVAGVLFHFSFSKLLLRPLALTILRWLSRDDHLPSLCLWSCWTFVDAPNRTPSPKGPALFLALSFCAVRCCSVCSVVYIALLIVLVDCCCCATAAAADVVVQVPVVGIAALVSGHSIGVFVADYRRDAHYGWGSGGSSSSSSSGRSTSVI